MSTQIKPCPFCGGTASIWQKGFYDKNRKETAWLVFVKCDMCRSTGKMFVADDEDEPSKNNWDTYECQQAKTAWNMRSKNE